MLYAFLISFGFYLRKTSSLILQDFFHKHTVFFQKIQLLSFVTKMKLEFEMHSCLHQIVIDFWEINMKIIKEFYNDRTIRPPSQTIFVSILFEGFVHLLQ